MANSLTIQGQVTYQSPASSQLVNEFFNLQAATAPAGTALNKQIASLTNTVGLVALDGVASPGIIVLRNLDNTNSISYGTNTSAAQAGLLLPGDVAIWRPNGANLYAGTVTGTAKLQIFATPT